MLTGKSRYWSMLLTASALATPGLAQAQTRPQTEREKALEERLLRLESEMTQLRADLTAARGAQAETAAAVTAAATRSEEAATRVAALEAKPQAPAEGFRVGATTFKMGGFIKAVTSATRYSDGEVPGGSLGKEFYLPQQIPVGGGASSRDFMTNARQTRLFFDTATPLGGKELKGHIEFDFALATAPAGAQRATNPYTPTLRRAFFTYGRWLIGQDWTTFQNPAHLPESTDFVGPLEGTVFVRQMLVQYRQPLGEGLDLYLAAENPQTETITTSNAALGDNDQDRIPDFVAKLVYRTKTFDFHVAGLARQLSSHAGGTGSDTLGWGVSTGGKIAFGPDNRHDVRFGATYGQGIGRYLGLGYAPDAVYDAAVLGDRLHLVNNLAAFGSLRLGWTSTLRSTFAAGYQRADYPGGIVLPALANRSAYSLAGNLFWSPVRNLDLGIEYRHAGREVVSGLEGQMDRVEMAAKYTF